MVINDKTDKMDITEKKDRLDTQFENAKRKLLEKIGQNARIDDFVLFRTILDSEALINELIGQKETKWTFQN